MNLAHFHLVLNHIPVVGIPVALAFLVHGIWTKNNTGTRFSLLVLIAIAVIVIPVYLTGEPAEKLVEHLPGVTESAIEPHEEAAEVSLVLTLVTGAAAVGALWFQKYSQKGRLANFGVLGIGSISVLSLLYTANLGGKVRHSELGTEGAKQPVSESTGSKESERDE